MAGKQQGFYWKADTLTKLAKNTKHFPASLDRAVTAAVEYQATRAEGFMKREAPWTDRTSNARNGLFTATQHTPGVSHKIICAHSVPYGIWLEVRFSGKYAIIPKTLKEQGDELMRLVNKLLSGLQP